MIKAVIFDLDGLIIDSEPLWQEAEILVFQQVNIMLTPQLCLKTKGLRIDQVVDYWYQRYPWRNYSQTEIAELIVKKVIELIHLKGEPLAGVEDTIAFIEEKPVKIALASSSATIIIQAALQKLELIDKFTQIYSAESEALGKPHPGVYLTTARQLNVSPQECLALEDSLNGVLAAKAAQMKCIAVPETLEYNNPKFAIADVILKSLKEFNEDIWQKVI
ncbi:hypothetical protein NIES4102_07220 [Chondrocystis sp. NIES-4102]|nr:hypothetical protein NIES4102_07220 [Chondrocystis sp. NIES-4102]